MWESVVNILVQLLGTCFSWMTTIYNAMPGAWDTFFTLFVIIVISKFLLGPIGGFAFNAGSDVAAAVNKMRSSGKKKNEGK